MGRDGGIEPKIVVGCGIEKAFVGPSPLGRSLEILIGMGVSETKKPSVGRVWVLSGTTHY